MAGNVVHGLPKVKFISGIFCNACAKGKHTKLSFKAKKEVSTSRPLELLHMDLCGPIRVLSRGGKKSILVVVDDFSRYTWVKFLRTKDETTEELMVFFKFNQI